MQSITFSILQKRSCSISFDSWIHNELDPHVSHPLCYDFLPFLCQICTICRDIPLRYLRMMYRILLSSFCVRSYTFVSFYIFSRDGLRHQEPSSVPNSVESGCGMLSHYPLHVHAKAIFDPSPSEFGSGTILFPFR